MIVEEYSLYVIFYNIDDVYDENFNFHTNTQLYYRVYKKNS